MATDRRATTGPHDGFTLVELVIVVAIVGILASAALPLARWSVKRNREYQLQQNLRILRDAIDRYHDAATAGLIEVEEGASGFPPSLQVLVEGVPLISQMPPVMPAAADTYSASGPGLTGGLVQQLAQGQQQAPPGTAMTPGASPRTPSLFGGASTSGTAPARPGLQLGARLGSGTPGGATAGTQRPSPGAAPLGLSIGAATALGQADDASADAQPLLGADGRPVMVNFLRRIPIDPFTGTADWGQRCHGDPPTDRLWCGRDVFDVFSKSIVQAIDGTHYRDW